MQLFVFTCSAAAGLSRSFLVDGGVCELSGLLSSSSSSSSLLRFEAALVTSGKHATQTSFSHQQTLNTSNAIFGFFPVNVPGLKVLTCSAQRGRCRWLLCLHTGPCILIGCLLLSGLDKGCGLGAARLSYGRGCVHQTGRVYRG